MNSPAKRNRRDVTTPDDDVIAEFRERYGKGIRPSDIHRSVTHTTIASVARLMGFTPVAVTELCEGIEHRWQTIGLTRIGKERVNARRPKAEYFRDAETGELRVRGTLEFSVGRTAFELTTDAKRRAEIRREIAEEIVSRIESERGYVIRPTRVVKGDMVETVPEQHQASIVPVLAPRDHKAI